MIMLDTNTCIYIIRQRPEGVRKRLSRFDPAQICISVATYAELQYGVERSSSKKMNQVILDAYSANLSVIPWDLRAAKIYGRIRTDLEKKGTPIGNMDFLIAAHALSRGDTLITNNLEEFKRVRGLICRNWME